MSLVWKVMSDMRMSHVKHFWMSHVTHVNESRHTCEWVMSHMWMSHVTRVNELCHTCEGVMSLMWMTRSHWEWIRSHIWMSHVAHMNESCHTYEWVMSYVAATQHIVSLIGFICKGDSFSMTRSHVTNANESFQTCASLFLANLRFCVHYCIDRDTVQKKKPSWCPQQTGTSS